MTRQLEARDLVAIRHIADKDVVVEVFVDPEIEELEGQELKRKRSAYKAAGRPKSAHYPD